jgi:glutamine amidotransferase
MNPEKICVLDTKSSNLSSLTNMLKFLNVSFVVSNEKKDIEIASKIILPGVGAFGNVTDTLRESTDLNFLEKQIHQIGKPILGICVGMQIMTEVGYENGVHEGLGWLPGKVKIFEDICVPHVGWNQVKFAGEFNFIEQQESLDFYFTHSYRVEGIPDGFILGTTIYGEEFVSAIRKDNIFGVQFHPEKSQLSGVFFMKNFLNL